MELPREIVLVVEPMPNIEGRKYSTFKLKFAAVEDGKLDTWLSVYKPNEARFSNLVLTCGVYVNQDGTLDARSFKAGVDSYDELSLADAERITQTLRNVEAVRKKFPIDPVSFGQYAAMICKGLRVNRFAVPVENGDLRFYGIANVQNHIDYQIQQFHKSKIEKKAEAA